MSTVGAVKVVAVMATYRRPFEVGRLLDSLEKSTVPFHGIVVTDNAGDAATQERLKQSSIAHRVVQPEKNLGCGGGLRVAEEEAFRAFPELTHIFIMDDDVVFQPDSLALLLEAMAAHGATAATPIIHDADNRLFCFPGLANNAKFRVIIRAKTPDEYIARCGAQPEEITWAPGVAVLVERATFERVGVHRDDMWIRGEDFDFSLRITSREKALMVPAVRAAHLPPGGGKVTFDFPERMKHAAMVQNCAYLGVYTKHSRGLLRYWPGNAWRHLKFFGLRTIGDVWVAFWQGAIRGRPAGAPKGDHFRRRLYKE